MSVNKKKSLLKKIWNNKLLMTILFTFILSLIFILPQIIRGKGMFSLVADFNQEQIPFNVFANKLIKEGNTTYNFYNGLGTGFIESYGFYILGSPFFLLSLLFKSSSFGYIVGPMIILKFIITSIISYLYLNRYFKNKNYVMLGALLYTFSGFQLISLQFYHFMDVICFFPLLLWSLDKLMYDDKKGLFLISVFINCLVNYYFFIGEVIFVFLYYLVKVITKNYKFTIKSFISIFIESVLGIISSSIILIPSLLICMGNPKTEASHSILSILFYKPQDFIMMIKAFIFPAEAMPHNSLLMYRDYNSRSLYLPFIGLIPFFSYIFNKNKNWLSIFLKVCLVILFFPLFNGLFCMYTKVKYTRWLYMFILLIIMASLKAIEEKINFKKGYIAYFTLTIVFIIGCIIAKSLGFNVILFKDTFIINLAIAFLSLLLLYLINKEIKNQLKYIFIGVAITIPVTGLLIIKDTNSYFNDLHHVMDNNYTYELKDKIKIDNSINNRLDYANYTLTNINLMLEKPSVNVFNSIISNSSYEFYNSLGIKRTVESRFPDNGYYLGCFMNVKYVAARTGSNTIKGLSKDYKVNYRDEDITIFETDNNLNYGVHINNYISKKDFLKLKKEDRYKVLINTVVLNDKDIKKYKNKLNTFEFSSDYDKELLNANTKNKAIINDNTISKVISSKSNGIVVMQFSYDDNWEVTVNGKKREVINVDNGLLGVYVDKGTNNIKFTYKKDKYILCKYLTITGLLLSIIYIFINKKKN